LDLSELLRADERIDDLQRFGLKIIQHPKQFRFSTDAVLISEYATVKPRDRVIDLGTGSGIIPLLVYGRRKPHEIVGLEIVSEMADMASRSVKLNGLCEKIKIVNGNILDACELFGKESFDSVISNPPYIKAGSGELNAKIELSLARHEVLCKLVDIIDVSAKLLKSKGRLSLIHRPARLSEIIHHMMNAKLQPTRLRMVQPFEGVEPNMVMIEAEKGSLRELKVSPPLIIYKSPGEYTEETKKIYNES
jgi:Predicted O-methyltransferase